MSCIWDDWNQKAALLTTVNLNGKKIKEIHGFVIFVYHINLIVTEPLTYEWGTTNLELPEIIKQLHTTFQSSNLTKQ